MSELSCVFEAGKVTFVVGPTGAGKSTMFRLLMRQVSPQKGQISILGKNIANIQPDDFYAMVAIVPQDVVILNDTIAKNISFGRVENADGIQSAAKKAEIHDFIMNLPDGYDTLPGERGMTLSGGERQRLALARALFGEPKILLLDEASSALDAATERKIFATLRQLSPEMTIGAITHRREIIQDTDVVISLI